jgi:hypothetical protein
MMLLLRALLFSLSGPPAAPWASDCEAEAEVEVVGLTAGRTS